MKRIMDARQMELFKKARKWAKSPEGQASFERAQKASEATIANHKRGYEIGYL